MPLPFEDPEVAAYSRLLAQSYAHWTGRALTPDTDIPRALYHAPFALVSHGTEPDPVFRYANFAAQNLWGVSWEEFIRMPSRLSAEPVEAPAREKMLREALTHGYVDKYEGVRITKDGRRFRISNTTLWNVVDEAGKRHGQAAAIHEWKWL